MSSAHGRHFGFPPTAYLQPPADPRLRLPDDTAPQPNGRQAQLRERQLTQRNFRSPHPLRTGHEASPAAPDPHHDDVRTARTRH